MSHKNVRPCIVKGSVLGYFPLQLKGMDYPNMKIYVYNTWHSICISKCISVHPNIYIYRFTCN